MIHRVRVVCEVRGKFSFMHLSWAIDKENLTSVTPYVTTMS